MQHAFAGDKLQCVSMFDAINRGESSGHIYVHDMFNDYGLLGDIGRDAFMFAIRQNIDELANNGWEGIIDHIHENHHNVRAQLASDISNAVVAFIVVYLDQFKLI